MGARRLKLTDEERLERKRASRKKWRAKQRKLRRGDKERDSESDLGVEGDDLPLGSSPSFDSASEPVPAAQPPPPPPRVEVISAGGNDQRRDWREKYRGGGGREGACVEVANAYCGLLAKLSKWIEEAGGRPVIDVKTIQEVVLPAAVLTVDRLLPADFEVTPEVEVTIASGMLVGQALVIASRRKKGRSAPQSDPVAPRRPAPPAGEEPPASPVSGFNGHSGIPDTARY